MDIGLLTIITILLLISVASMLFYIVNAAYAYRYKIKDKSSGEFDEDEVTAIMPVYSEDPDSVLINLAVLQNQVKTVYLVVDGSSDNYDRASMVPGVVVIKNGVRMGKRESIANGISRVSTKFTLLIDADAYLQEGSVRKLLANFQENVGGVGANIGIKLEKSNKISYASEFLERSKETLMRAMSLRGSVSLLDGACAMYRTELIKSHILSPEFRGLRINGGIPYEGGGDDSELTSIVIRKGYLAIKDFDVMVMVSPKRTVKTFSKQLVRWTRNSWRSFFLNFRNGTAKKAGNFYRAEMIMTFAMPILFTIAIFIRAFFYVHTIFHHVTFGAIPSFTSLEFVLFSDLRRPIALLSSIMGSGGSFIFLSAAMNNVRKDRIRIIIYGAMASFLIFLASIYALITYHKASRSTFIAKGEDNIEKVPLEI